MTQHHYRPSFRIGTEWAEVQMEVIHAFLPKSHWARGIPREMVERTVAPRFGLYEGRGQVGFVPVVSDYETFRTLADVFVLGGPRGRELGKWPMECVMADPAARSFRKWVPIAADGHGLHTRVF